MQVEQALFNETKGIANYICEENRVAVKQEERVSDDGYMLSSSSVLRTDMTYQKPSQEEDMTVAEQLDLQMDMTAQNRRNQMVVLSNTMSPEDYNKLQEAGFSLSETDSHTIITVTDEIKAVLAKAGVDISVYGDTLSKEQLEEITGSVALASQITNALEANDLPTTKENVNEVTKAVTQAQSISELGPDATAFLLKNQLSPTIENLYKAFFSGGGSATENELFYNTTETTTLENLNEQIEKLLKDSGIEGSIENKNKIKWMVSNQISVTVSSIQYMNTLTTYQNASISQILRGIIQAIREGKRPLEGILLNGYSLQEKAQHAMDVISNCTDQDLAHCVHMQEEITIENLSVAMEYRNENGDYIEVTGSVTFIRAKRQLEETRLAMTAEANYALLKRGISIDTKPLVDLVEDLKNQEKSYYKELLKQDNTGEINSQMNSLQATTTALSNLKSAPAYILNFESSRETLTVLHERGQALKDVFVKANESYEALMTSPRADLGDSIRKAFANVDAILEDLGLEQTKEHQRAVRILAYNNTELTVENIQTIKAVDENVQRAFKNMTPAVTLEMIRENINPLEMDIETLNATALKIKDKLNTAEVEEFSKFLWKLEQNKEISQEERTSYIGIYRLMAQVEKGDGAAIGSLIQQGAEITMKNLLTAVRSKHKSGLDYEVSDDFGGVSSTFAGIKIDDQINASYQKNCLMDAKELITPEKMHTIGLDTIEGLTPEELKAKLEAFNNEEADLDMQYAKEQLSEYVNVLSASEDVYEYLTRYDMTNNMINVLSVSEMMRRPDKVMQRLWKGIENHSDGMEAIAQIKAEIMETFGEAIKTPDEMVKAQETLAEIAENVMKNMIIREEQVSALDLKEMRLMTNQFRLCAQKAREESYMVPVETSEGVGGVSLKIVRKKDEKGLVDILFRQSLAGKIAASFQAQNDSVSGTITVSEERIKEQIEANIEEIKNRLKQNQTDTVTIRVAVSKDLSLEKFENRMQGERTQSEVLTKRLYHIAEEFIKTISETL